MSNNQGDPFSAADARDSRRWLIGVGISLAFGLFGVVMALLAYSERSNTSAPAAAKPPAAKGPTQAEPNKDVRRRRDRK